MMIKEKQCTKCKRILPIEKFWLNRCQKDGYEHWCIDCLKKYRETMYKKLEKERSKISITEKKCTKCQRILPISEFSPCRGFRDGYSLWCKKCRRDYTREYSRKNKELLREKARDYRQKNRNEIAERRKKSYAKNLQDWVAYFKTKYGEVPHCQICGVRVKWYTESPGRARTIAFDHRNGGKEAIKSNPVQWLRSHQFNEKNIRIWESCNFGILCNRCNKALFTKDRKEWVRNVVKYVFGKELGG